MKAQKNTIARINFNESKKITDKLEIKAKADAYYIRDTELNGFWVRVPSGNTDEATYLVNAKPQNSRKDLRRSIGKVSLYKAKDAREIARGWIQQIKAGADPKEKVRKQHAQSQKLREAFEQYISDRSAAEKLGERSIQNYRADMEGRLASLMAKQINSLTDELISNWYRKNITEARTQTDRAYRELNAVLGYQVAIGNLERNPATVVKTLGMQIAIKPKTSYLTTDECGRLLCEMVSFRRDNKQLTKQTNLLLFMLLTGLREKTVYNLRWEQVTLRASVAIETTKNGESYLLPLTTLLNDILEQQREITPQDCEWVFPNKRFDGPTIDPKKSLNRLYKVAGINKNFSDHDIRRTFASLADLAKVPFTDIKHLMVHKKRDITEKYMQSQQIKAKENYERISDLLASVTPVAFHIDEGGKEVTNYMTADLIRYLLFNKGKLTNHPDRNDPNFLVEISNEFYQAATNVDWD